MKTQSTVVGLIIILFLLCSNKVEAQKKTIVTPSTETLANAYFRNSVTSQSGGALSPTSFSKTNGYESGFGIYVIEWQANVLVTRDCFKFAYTGDWLWKNFAVTDRGVGGLDALVMQTSPLSQGTTVRLTGTATFRKTEKGPRLEAFDVKTSQRLGTKLVPPKQPAKPKVVPKPRATRETALLNAAEKGDVIAVRTLLTGGANINAADTSDQPTALLKAILGNHIAVVQLLLAKGANVEAKDGRGMPALIYAAELGRLEIVHALLAKGALIEAKDATGVTALARAALWGHLSVVDALISKGADVNAGGNATADGVIVETPLTWAADYGRVDVVQLLLAKGADPNKKGNSYAATPLICAAKDGLQPRKPGASLEIVRALLDKGADPNLKDNSPWTALMWAAHDGKLDIVDVLVAKGVDIEAKDNAGHTALMLAAMQGQTATVQRLLEKGASKNAKNTDGKTALDLANSNNHNDTSGIIAASLGTEAQKLIVGLWKTKDHTLDFHSDGSYEFAIHADWLGHTAVVNGTWSIHGDIITMKESKPQTGGDSLVNWSRQWRIIQINSDRFEMKGLEFLETYNASRNGGNGKTQSISAQSNPVSIPNRSEHDRLYGQNIGGTSGNLADLAQEIEAGKEITIPVRLNSGMGINNMVNATIKLAKTRFGFSASCCWVDFTVTPDKIVELTNQRQQNPAGSLQRLHLKVLITNRKGKEEKKDFYLYNTAAQVEEGTNGYGPIICSRCDDSLTNLFALLQKIHGQN